MPQVALREDSAGVDAFIRYFWVVYNYGRQWSDPGPLKAISDDDCVYCQSARDAITQQRVSGTRVQDASVEPINLIVPPTGLDSTPLITYGIAQGPGKLIDRSGEPIEIFDGDPESLCETLLIRGERGWTVGGVVIRDPV